MFKYLFFSLSLLGLASLGHTTNVPDMEDPTVTLCLEVFNSSDTVPATGVKKVYRKVPYNFTVRSWELTADQSGSAAVGVIMDSPANFPPTSADNIVSSSTPSATTVLYSSGTTASWGTTSIPQGYYLDLNEVSITSWTRYQLCLIGTRN